MKKNLYSFFTALFIFSNPTFCKDTGKSSGGLTIERLASEDPRLILPIGQGSTISFIKVANNPSYVLTVLKNSSGRKLKADGKTRFPHFVYLRDYNHLIRSQISLLLDAAANPSLLQTQQPPKIDFDSNVFLNPKRWKDQKVECAFIVATLTNSSQVITPVFTSHSESAVEVESHFKFLQLSIRNLGKVIDYEIFHNHPLKGRPWLSTGDKLVADKLKRDFILPHSNTTVSITSIPEKYLKEMKFQRYTAGDKKWNESEVIKIFDPDEY